jgi:hypothetical protein
MMYVKGLTEYSIRPWHLMGQNSRVFIGVLNAAFAGVFGATGIALPAAVTGLLAVDVLRRDSDKLRYMTVCGSTATLWCMF